MARARFGRLAALLALSAASACAPAGSQDRASAYEWTRVAAAAEFPKGYNFPVHVLSDGRFAALTPSGIWLSSDGAWWRRSASAPPGMNSAYLPYVQHDGASWAFGSLSGDYTDFRIDPLVRRTRDYRQWETVGRSATLPRNVFAAGASFNGSLWLLGGYDGTRAHSQVWRSPDGLRWERVAERAPWSPRAGAKALTWRGRLFLIGGGEIDGEAANDVWSSADGVEWRRETASIAPEKPVGYTPAVFDGRLWLIGANRSGAFSSAILESADGRSWRATEAPWSPRGGVAAWTDGARLFVTGGKYSVRRGGEQVFIYSNDVWAMRRR